MSSTEAGSGIKKAGKLGSQELSALAGISDRFYFSPDKV
jgi:hypothetical protein